MARNPSTPVPDASAALNETIAQADDPRGELVEVVEVSDSDAERIKAALAPPSEDESAAGFEVSGRVLTVRAVRPAGRRRGGIQFGRDPVELNADDLSEDQLGQILADPELTVIFGD